jgi:lipopolysaccharide biosynthesis glycosyltransferase
MIHSWKEHFSKDYLLHLYLEDFTIDNSDERIIIEEWNAVNDLYSIWEKRGFIVRKKQPGFIKKALTQIAAFKKLENEKIIWLDADIITLKQIPDNFFNSILENYPLAVWDWNNKGFETGTFFVDTSAPHWKETEKIYSDLYITDRTSEENDRWFDGEVLEIAVRESKIPYKNLCKYQTKKSKVPINRSWIGEFLRHFMAQYKDRIEFELKDCGREDLIELLKKEKNNE